MPIDIDELLELLPALIRENDTVKGAILSALSGVVATHQDILMVMDEFDKRFEAMDRRFEALQLQIGRGFEEARRDRLRMNAALDALGSRAGVSLESAVLELMDALLVKAGVDYSKVEKITLVDPRGEIFFPNYSTDIDILAQDGQVHLFEVKFKADQRDVFHFMKNAELYERTYQRRPVKLYLITLDITERTPRAVAKLPVEVIAGQVLP